MTGKYRHGGSRYQIEGVRVARRLRDRLSTTELKNTPFAHCSERVDSYAKSAQRVALATNCKKNGNLDVKICCKRIVLRFGLLSKTSKRDNWFCERTGTQAIQWWAKRVRAVRDDGSLRQASLPRLFDRNVVSVKIDLAHEREVWDLRTMVMSRKNSKTRWW